MKQFITLGLVFYLASSLLILYVRVLTGDCVYRYMNYVFPVSILHCEIK